MKAVALVMEKPSSTLPSHSLSPCLPLCPQEVCRQWVLGDAQHRPSQCHRPLLGALLGPQKHTEHPMGLAPAHSRLPHDSKLPAGKRWPPIYSSGCLALSLCTLQDWGAARAPLRLSSLLLSVQRSLVCKVPNASENQTDVTLNRHCSPQRLTQLGWI